MTRARDKEKNGPAHHESLAAQLVRAPNRYLGGHGFDSRRGLKIFSLSHARVIVEIYIFIIYHRAQNLPSLLLTKRKHVFNSQKLAIFSADGASTRVLSFVI